MWLFLSGQAMAAKTQEPKDPIVVDCTEKALLITGKLLEVQAKFENYELLKDNYSFKEQQQKAKEILADYDKSVAEMNLLQERCCKEFKTKNYRTRWPELYRNWECK